MKKFLFTLILALSSISMYSQSVRDTKSYYDSSNTKYVKTTIINTTYKTINCVVFTIIYQDPLLISSWDYEDVKVSVTVPPRSYKRISYYPPANKYEAKEQYLKRIIFTDGTYRDY